MGAPVEEGRGDAAAGFTIEEPELRADGRSLEAIEAVGAIDGRYRRVTQELEPYFSERALIGHRLMVEVEYLIALSEHPEVGCREFTDEEKEYLRSLPDVEAAEANVAKAIEVRGFTPPGGEEIPKTDHDVKAVEYYLRLKMEGTSLEDSVQWVHFALTSEDVNNLSYALMIEGATENVMLPALYELESQVRRFAREYRDVPMLGRTHGQPASPTTVGKQFEVFAARLDYTINQIENHRIRGKLNGATGNFNAHLVAYPEVDWERFSEQFIRNLGGARANLEPNPTTTQIEPHDSYVVLFDMFSRLNEGVIDMNQDIWRYISDKWIVEKPDPDRTGSSTMPHKVNPIKFENGEGRLDLANAQFAGFHRLLRSRLQRDLSDSTVQRSIGEAFANSLIGYRSTLAGFAKIEVNEPVIREVLDDHPEVITEAIQTILRREGRTDAYEVIKKASRGKHLDAQAVTDLIDGLDVSDEVKAELHAITPQNYIGNAAGHQGR